MHHIAVQQRLRKGIETIRGFYHYYLALKWRWTKKCTSVTVSSTTHSILGKTKHKAVYDHCRTVCCGCCFISYWPSLQLAPQRRLCRLKGDTARRCWGKWPPGLHISSRYRIWGSPYKQHPTWHRLKSALRVSFLARLFLYEIRLPIST